MVLFRSLRRVPHCSNSGRGGGIRTPIPGFGDRSPNRWTTPLESPALGESLTTVAPAASDSPSPSPLPYFTSFCAVCLRQVLQNFLVSRRSECFFLFLVVV